jgi:hypothetical protein
MPCLQEPLPVPIHDIQDHGDLTHRIAVVISHLQGIEPDLDGSPAVIDVHVRRLVRVTAVEVDTSGPAT